MCCIRYWFNLCFVRTCNLWVLELKPLILQNLILKWGMLKKRELPGICETDNHICFFSTNIQGFSENIGLGSTPRIHMLRIPAAMIRTGVQSVCSVYVVIKSFKDCYYTNILSCYEQPMSGKIITSIGLEIEIGLIKGITSPSPEHIALISCLS